MISKKTLLKKYFLILFIFNPNYLNQGRWGTDYVYHIPTCPPRFSDLPTALKSSPVSSHWCQQPQNITWFTHVLLFVSNLFKTQNSIALTKNTLFQGLYFLYNKAVIGWNKICKYGCEHLPSTYLLSTYHFTVSSQIENSNKKVRWVG